MHGVFSSLFGILVCFFKAILPNLDGVNTLFCYPVSLLFLRFAIAFGRLHTFDKWSILCYGKFHPIKNNIAVHLVIYQPKRA
jgi:hypothetical protein